MSFISDRFGVVGLGPYLRMMVFLGIALNSGSKTLNTKP